MVFEHATYRSYLRAVMDQRILRNPAYSLRAFASALGLAPSMVSNLFSGKKNISGETALDVCERLGLTGQEREYFCLLVQLERAKSVAMRQSVQTRLQAIAPRARIYDLSVDRFRLISDWYHLPILEMSNLPDVSLTPPTVAKALGITETQAREALERLTRLELLSPDPEGRPRKTHDNLLVKSATPSDALRRYNLAMADKSRAALEEVDPHDRLSHTQNFVFDAKQLEKARVATREFMTRMCELARETRAPRRAGSSRAALEVFHLNVQMFSLTSPLPRKKRKEER